MKPAYRIEYVSDGNARLTDMAWKSETYGRPTAENLAKVVAKYNESFGPGGVNEVVGSDLRIVRAALVHQSSGIVKAEVTA